MSQSAKSIDADALRARYRAERDKRLRADGNNQYVEVKGDFRHFVDDPYIETPIVREPLADEVDVVVVGGGFGGLIAGAQLRKAGVKSLRLIEKGGDFGGTWYWNRYPGAACDIESYIYLPLLEETGYMPVEKYTRAPEILAHSRRIAEHFDLYDNALLQTEVTSCDWDDAARRWIVHTNRGDAVRAKYLIQSNGPLHRPKLPGIPGVGDFKGHTFHTSRWDYAYTGGDTRGNLDRLKDKRVGIIGTGATAVQCVPHLAASAKALYVFQRTPSSVDVRNDRPTDMSWAATLEPGWQKKRMENFNNLVIGIPQKEDMVKDGWTDIIRNLVVKFMNGEVKVESPQQAEALMEMADFEKMEQVRARVDAIVTDHATAEALKPWYRQFCKRPCFHDDYLAAFNRPTVTLVNTDGRGVERITETAVVANGETYEIDCLIFATGFEVGTEFTRRSGYELYGRDGVTLSGAWAEGVKTLHGLTVRGFPNMFILGGPQGGFTANYPHNLDEQSAHVAHLIDEGLKSQAQTIEPTQGAVDAWTDEIIAKARMRDEFLAECTPGYYNNEGQPNPAARQASFYGAGAVAYFATLKQWREAGAYAGLEFDGRARA
jgi:cation diffusion facilitator CzcD-associated flavoprotein CzcO